LRQISAQVLDDESLQELQSGHSLLLVRAGEPLAEIIPVAQQPRNAEEHGQDRLHAVQQLKEIMNQGFDMGVVWNGRNELYDRD